MTESRTSTSLTLVINVDGDQVRVAPLSAGLVGDADAVVVQLEAGDLADVDVAGPVGEDGVEGDAQASAKRHQDGQHRAQHSSTVRSEKISQGNPFLTLEVYVWIDW